MKEKIRLTALALLLLVQFSYGQRNYEPLDLAKKIFGKEKFSQIRKYVTGEYEGRPNGRDLKNGAITRFKLLGQTEKSAVVNLTIVDSNGKGFDSYLHFQKDGIWKVNAFRALALSGIIEQAIIHLESLSAQQIDTLFSSRAEYEFQLGNAKLTLELDENIIDHFIANQAEFNRIKDAALQELENRMTRPDAREQLVENLKQDYQRLLINSVSTGGYEPGNVINFLIGGLVDNSVGYFYVKEKEDLPKMSPNRIIMIREIGNGWYLFKTT